MNNLLSSVRHCSGTTQVEIFLSDHLNGIHRRPSDETQTGDKMNGRKKEGGGIARLLAGFCNRVVMQSDHGVSSRHWNESTCVFSERQPCLWFISCFRTVLQRLSLSTRLPFLRHGIVLPSSPRFFFCFLYLRCQPKHRCLGNGLTSCGFTVHAFLCSCSVFLVLFPWLLYSLTRASFRVHAFTCFIGENRNARGHIV